MENQLIPDEIIMNKIYYIGGQKVMMDKDLADCMGLNGPDNLNAAYQESLSFFDRLENCKAVDIIQSFSPTANEQ
jgi:hypothetical protein